MQLNVTLVPQLYPPLLSVSKTFVIGNTRAKEAR
jgi:hypothetical protein